MKTLTCLVFVLLCIGTNAQNHYCYTDQVFKQMVEEDPSILKLRNATEATISKQSNELAAKAAQAGSRAGDEQPMVVIPTVIYIVHDGTSASNISMQQIQSQMDQLNEDFAPHGYTFCYAKKDVTTTMTFPVQPTDSIGVFRINNSNLSDLDQYGEDAQLKALSTLPYKNYLRIYVVSDITPQGVLGYSTFAGCSSPKDGIVVRADVFGSNNYCQTCTFFPDYNLGAVLTHEAGHYLNLYHTFEGGCTPEPEPNISCQQFGDQICDTPPTTGDYGCPAQTILSCDNTNPRPIHNYMDYTNDACKNNFTMGQKIRMDFSMNAYRYLLKSSANLIATGINCVELGNAYAEMFCRNYNGCIGRAMTFESLNTPGFTYKWYFGDGDSVTGNTVTHSYAAEGQYVLTLRAINTSLNVTAASNVTIFVTPCEPALCSARKWDSNYAYLDFSSGTPVAVNHVALETEHPFPLFYNSIYRDDAQGNSLFHLYPARYPTRYHDLVNAAFQKVDSLRFLNSIQVLPVLATPGKYCILGNPGRIDAGVSTYSDSIIYYYIQAQNGTASVLPGKRAINVPLPAGANYIDGRYTITSIPSCNGQNFWTVVNLVNGGYAVLKVAADTVTVHQTYYIPNSSHRVLLTASPDGRKIYAGLISTNGLLGFYILDFDKGIGNITGYREFIVSDDLQDWAQQVCFSPNSRFLYVQDQCCPETLHGNIGHIYQMDLYDPEPWLNKKSIYEFPRNGNEDYTPLQLAYNAPDGKIYVAHVFQGNNRPESYRLGVINYPNELDLGNNNVGYNDNGPYIIPANCPYPEINITSITHLSDQNNAHGCTWQPNAPPTYNYYPTSCTNYKFYTDDCYTHTWNFGDPASGANNTSSLSEPIHNFSAPGNYKITLVANGQTFTDTLHVTAPKADVSIFAATDCAAPQSYYSVTNIQPGVKYIWKLMNGTPDYAEDVSAITVQWNSGIASTQLTLVAIDTINGCSDSSVTNITFSANGQIAEPQISVVNNVLSTTAYATYQWLLNGNIIPNANQQQYTATQNGTYTVIVTNTGGCADTSKARQFILTNIEELNNIAMALYPNPATSEVTIVTNFETGSINVYNTQGKQVYSYDISGTSQTLNVADWTGGVYYIEVNSKGKTVRKKFVKL